jgi:hypothetical protein
VSSPPPPDHVRLRRPTAEILPSSAYWRGWPEIRADLRSSVGLVLAFALAGGPTGLVWWLLAPRVDFRITDTGPTVVGTPSEEVLVADDTVLLAVLAVVGLAGGATAWFLRRRRGVATVLALAVGGVVAGLVAWQVGEFLGTGPTEAQLSEVGGVVTSSLTLGSLAVLAGAPFTALLAYLVAVLYAPGDDLGRAEPAAPAADRAPDLPPLDDERPLSSPSWASRTAPAAPAPRPGSAGA